MARTGRFTLREAWAEDLPFLEEMLFEAFFWDPSAPRPDPARFREDPEFAKLLRDWGGREGDTAIVAERDGRPIGAAWYRAWSEDEHSYGFVSPAFPEIAVGVAASERAGGVGRAMLEALIETARRAGVAGLSLSVDPRNPAMGLYAALGFEEVGRSGSSPTMLLRIRSGGR